MERMKDLEEMLRELSEKYKNSKSVEVYEEDLEGWFKIIDDLREENKKLNEEIQRFKDNAMQDMREITELEIENKKLNEKVRFLEECLDRKEKLNEEYRKEIEELKSTYVYDAKQVRDIC